MENEQIQIPEGWGKLRFNKLGQIYNGLSGKKKEDFINEGRPYIPYVNVFNHSVIKSDEIDYVLIKKGEKQNRLKYGDLLFTTSSETIEEVGMTSVFLGINDTFYLNSFCFGFRLYNFTQLEPEYAQYLFRTQNVRYDISLLGQGSTRYNLSKTRLLSELKLTLPKSTTEQKKIAEILSKVDTAIEQTQSLIAKYQRIKTGLMQDLLTKGIPKNTLNFVKTDLKNILVNDEYTISTLGANTEVRQGYQIEISSRKKDEGKNRFVYITVQYLNNPDKYLEFIENPPKSVISSQDDILFTRTGNTGQIVTGIVGVYHNNFFKVDFNKTAIIKEYLLLFLQWKPVQDLILELAGTTTIPDLKHKDFYSIPFFFPKDKAEQLRISNIINKSSDKILVEQTQLKKLQSIKTALMQDLLSGKKRVTNLIKENAL